MIACLRVANRSFAEGVVVLGNSSKKVIILCFYFLPTRIFRNFGVLASSSVMLTPGILLLLGVALVAGDIFKCEPCQKVSQPSRMTRSIDLNAAHALIADARLPREVTPNGYRLELQPFPEEGNFKGRVRVNITWQETTSKITLHVHPDLVIAHSEVTVTQYAGDDSLKSSTVMPPTSINVLQTERVPKKPLYIIHLSKPLNRGTQCEVDITFCGKLMNDTSEGFFRNNYIDPSSTEKRWFVATHMRPNLARRVFPCFDEPAYKVPFLISVARRKNMTSQSNMPLARTDDIPGEPGWVWDHFQESPPMSTFTVGILVSDFKNLMENASEPDPNTDQIKINVWGRPDYLEALKEVHSKVEQVLIVLQEYWGVPYPLPKLDIVALPNYQAVKPADNWGLIFFKESELSNRGVWHIAQEMVYQWLGDFATPFWWSDAHINKALASYLAAVTSFTIDNGKDMQGKWPMTVLYSLYYEFSKRYPHARIAGMKQETTSVKTELVFRMLNYTLGENTFKHGLQRFMVDRQFKTFFGDDVWAALTEQTKFDRSLPETITVNEIAASWITKDRLPVINVTRHYHNNSATIRQRVYLRDRPHDVPDQDKLLWWIPIVMVTQERLNFLNATPSVWMKKEREIVIDNLPNKDNFIIVNPEEIGPFPVNYDVVNWNMLAQFLLNNEGRTMIPINTRAKLLHDAWNLAYAGDLSFSTALNMTLFLKHERDHLAWDPVFTMIDHIGRHIDSSEVHKKFETYVRKLLTPLYEELGDQPKEGEDSGTTHLRSLSKVFLCRAGYKPCIEEAQAAYNKWMSSENPDEGNPVPNQYICPVFKWGTHEEWDFGLQRVINFPASRKQSERTYLLKTLAGCPVDCWKIERLLNITILEENGNFTDNDIYLIFSMLTGGANGYMTLFNFLNDHWENIKLRFAEKTHLWDSLITSATTVFTTQEGLDMVSELYVERQGEFGTAEHIIEKALKNIKEETKWSDDNLPVIESWLDDYLSNNENKSTGDKKFL